MFKTIHQDIKNKMQKYSDARPNKYSRNTSKKRVPRPYVLGDKLKKQLMPASYGSKISDYKIIRCSVYGADKRKKFEFDYAKLDNDGNLLSAPISAPACFGNLKKAPKRWCKIINTPERKQYFMELKKQSMRKYLQAKVLHGQKIKGDKTCVDKCILSDSCRSICEARINIMSKRFRISGAPNNWHNLMNVTDAIDNWIVNYEIDYSSRTALEEGIQKYETWEQPFDDLLKLRETEYKRNREKVLNRSEIGKEAKHYLKQHPNLISESEYALTLFFKFRRSDHKWRQKNNPELLTLLFIARCFFSERNDIKPDSNNMAMVISHMASTSKKKYSPLIHLFGKDRIESLTECGRKALKTKINVLDNVIEEDGNVLNFTP